MLNFLTHQLSQQKKCDATMKISLVLLDLIESMWSSHHAKKPRPRKPHQNPRQSIIFEYLLSPFIHLPGWNNVRKVSLCLSNFWKHWHTPYRQLVAYSATHSEFYQFLPFEQFNYQKNESICKPKYQTKSIQKLI